MIRRFVVTLDVDHADHTRPNIWRDWIEDAIQRRVEEVRITRDDDTPLSLNNFEVEYAPEPVSGGVWQASASAYHMFEEDREQLEPATIEEVREAVAAYGLDASLVEQIDKGLFHIPIPKELEEFLMSPLNPGGAHFEMNGVDFELEMP